MATTSAKKKKALESKEVGTEIAFLISIIPVFDEFITKFQREEPVIQTETLLKRKVGRLMKSRVTCSKQCKVRNTFVIYSFASD